MAGLFLAGCGGSRRRRAARGGAGACRARACRASRRAGACPGGAPAEPTTITFALDWVRTRITQASTSPMLVATTRRRASRSRSSPTTTSPRTTWSDRGKRTSGSRSAPAFRSLVARRPSDRLGDADHPAADRRARLPQRRRDREPEDLDGKTYAGFGAPYEVPIITEVIKADGGKGEFENVTLNTFAYEAVPRPTRTSPGLS